MDIYINKKKEKKFSIETIEVLKKMKLIEGDLEKSLEEINNEIRDFITSFKKLSIPEKFSFVLKVISKGSKKEIASALIFFENNLTIEKAEEQVDIACEVLLEQGKLGLIKNKDKYDYYSI